MGPWHLITVQFTFALHDGFTQPRFLKLMLVWGLLFSSLLPAYIYIYFFFFYIFPFAECLSVADIKMVKALHLFSGFNFNTICFITDSVTWEAYSTWVKIEQKLVHCLYSVTSDDPSRIPSPELEDDTTLQLYTSPLHVE